MTAPNPFQAPQSELPPGAAPEVEPLVYCNAWTRRRILNVAFWQNCLMVTTGLLLIFSSVVYFNVAQQPRVTIYASGADLQRPLLLSIFLLILHSFYNLAKFLDARSPALLTMLLLTGIGLLFVPYYSYRATKFLRSFGFNASWLGTRPGRLEKLIRVSEE